MQQQCEIKDCVDGNENMIVYPPEL